jgi:hypothetical protein
MTIENFFEMMERIHWNFGLPYQYKSLSESLEGIIL